MSKFKVGDKVKLTGNKILSMNDIGDVGTVVEVSSITGNVQVQVPNGPNNRNWSSPHDLVLVDDSSKLWGDMTDEEQGALLLAHHRGEVVQYRSYNSKWPDSWTYCKQPGWKDHVCYRIQPKPVVEEVVWWVNQNGNVKHSEKWIKQDNVAKITYSKIDGEFDWSSLKGESL